MLCQECQGWSLEYGLWNVDFKKKGKDLYDQCQ